MADIKPPATDIRARAESAVAAGVISEETLRRIVNGRVSRQVLEQVRKAVAKAMVMAEASGPANSDNGAGGRARRHRQELAAAQALHRAVVQLLGGGGDLDEQLVRAADELAAE